MQETVGKSFRLKLLCSRILEKPIEWNVEIKAIQKLLPDLPRDMIQKNLSAILSVGYLIFKNLSESKRWFVVLNLEVL